MAALEVLVHLAAPLDDLLHLRFQLFNTSPSGHPGSYGHSVGLYPGDKSSLICQLTATKLIKLQTLG